MWLCGFYCGLCRVESCLALFSRSFFFSVIFSNVITPLGEERFGLCASRAFVYFARVIFFTVALPLDVGDWLRLVIVALRGLFY